MSKWLELDFKLFELFNQELTNPVFDAIMPYWRNKYFWAPMYLFVIVFLITNKYRKWWLILLILLLTMAFSDLISSHLIKPYVRRMRPCNNPFWDGTIHSLVPCGSGYSFTSSHAVNHFTLATLFSFLFANRVRWIVPVLFMWAGSIAYGQVYVGVHYPMDILFGTMVGLAIGCAGGTIIRRLDLHHNYL